MNRRWVRSLLWAAVIGLMAVIFLFSSQAGPASMETSGFFARPLTDLIASMMGGLEARAYDDLLVLMQMVVRKTAHFSEYALLGLLWRLLMASYQWKHAGWKAWAVSTAYAATDELHQLLGGERTGMWQDVVLDSLGVAAGVLISYLLLRSFRRRAENKS